jgi:hypothetical protein
MTTNRRLIAVLAVILFVCIAIVTPLAYASPADQSWLSGMYDEADHDDVVFLITSALDGVIPVGKVELEPSGQSASFPLPVAHSIPASVLATQPRAPPAH